MPITHNLGRINRCKIVGCKDRFIEVRCHEEPPGDEWECIDGLCQLWPGGPFASEILCLANPQSNHCIDAGMIDSGYVGTFGGFMDWIIANNPMGPLQGAGAYYYEQVPLPAGCTSGQWNDCCVGPNGGQIRYINPVSLYLNHVNVSGNFSVWNDLILWIQANGCPSVTNSMTLSTLNAEIHSCFNCGFFEGCNVSYQGIPCICEGCGSGPGESWECYEDPAGSYCQDPGDGSGQYPTEADCLLALANGINSCDEDQFYGGPPGVGGSDRVNAVPGTIFNNAGLVLEYYTTPANGISGIDAQTLFFEVYVQLAPLHNDGFSCKIHQMANTTCCEGPNSTIAEPTTMVFLPYMGWVYQYIMHTGVAQGSFGHCCPPISSLVQDFDWTLQTGMYVPWLQANADFESVYGALNGTTTTSWNWDEVLTDAIAAGAPLTMNTAYTIGLNDMVPGTFIYDSAIWLAGMPVVNHSCYGTFQTCPHILPPDPQTNPNLCASIKACAPVIECVCEPGCENITYDCYVEGCVCIDPGDGSGAFTGPTALADCQAFCCEVEESWNCKDGACTDPGDGTGQYTDANSGGSPGDGLAACLGSTGVDTCASNADHFNGNNSPRTHMAPGTIFGAFFDAIKYYTDPANGISGTNYDTFMYETVGQYGDFCEGPNSTIGTPTSMAYLSGLPGWRMSWNNGELCTPNPAQFSTCCSSWFNSVYGPKSLGPVSSFSGNPDPNLLAMTSLCGGGAICTNWPVYLTPGQANLGYTNFLAMVTFFQAQGLPVNPATTLVDITNPNNPLNLAQIVETYYTANPTAGQLEGTVYAALCYGYKFCECAECGGPDPWECVPEFGCIQQAGGQYATEGACLAANSWVNSCGGLVSFGTAQTYSTWNQAVNAASTQFPIGATNIDITTVYTYLLASAPDHQCLPLQPDGCPNVVSAGGAQVKFEPYIPYRISTGASLAGLNASYTIWDDFLTDAQAIPIAGIGPASSLNTVIAFLSVHYGFLCDISQDYTCCYCTEGCLPPEPNKDCLVLWLDALDIDSIALQLPPVLTGFQLIDTIQNKALPLDLTAYYTWDTIDGIPDTAPRYDVTTWSWPTLLFDKFLSDINLSQYLIANTAGPTPPRLEPDTTSDAAYGKGWTVFFHRATSASEWVNPHTWFMGDDWTISDDANKYYASGLKPDTQPYCKSNYYGHNHADSTAPTSTYEASPLNEILGTGHRTLQGGLWYVHWIIAEEQLPYGSDLFDVTWGVGSQLQFRDVIQGVDLDLILANINTRNRGKDNDDPGQGWFSEIRAYNCAFNHTQLNNELLQIMNKYGYSTLNLPVPPPPPCGEPFSSTAFDGVEITNTRLEVKDNGIIAPSQIGFTAAFWVKFNDCVDEDACLFEKGINLPVDNEQVAFRLFLSDDVGNVGNLYWDVFGDNPVDYLGNYSRTFSNVAWLGEADCASLVGKWKHVAVTMDGLNGINRKIYIDGIDKTGPVGGGISVITGKVRRNSSYSFNLGDSSRVDYTFKGNMGQFITWNTALTEDEIKEVYSGGNYFDPLVDRANLGPLQTSPYNKSKDVLFYTNMNSDPVIDLSKNHFPVIKYGGVSLINTDIDPVNAGLPTDIPGLQIWLKAGTKMLADQDVSNNVISRADYMIGNTLQQGDKIIIWECSGNTGRYVGQVTETYKPKYEGDGTNTPLAKGVYTNATDRLQIYNTYADGGINIDAANSDDQGAFTIMVRVRMEAGTIATENLMGDTSSNFIRINNSTQLRIKLGGGSNKNFTISSAITNTDTYIFTINRNVDGLYYCYIDGGVFDDEVLSGSGVHIETNAATIDHILGIPGTGMQGWFFDFMCWKDTILKTEEMRKAMYRVMNETVRTL